MEGFQLIKCPSCGSSVIESDSESILECSHCGSKLLVKNKSKQSYVALASVLFILVLILVALAWNNYSHQSMPIVSDVDAVNEGPKDETLKVKFMMPKINSKAMTDVLTKGKDNLPAEKAKITITSQVEAKTIIGGIYWIVGIRNDSNKTVIRPGVVMSLFDAGNKRIEEQKGWAKLGYLLPGKETEVLILIANPPTQAFTRKMTGIAKFASDYESYPEYVDVLDFVVNPKKDSNSRHVSIIGDVVNNNDFQVDFVKVVAVAKDEKGKPIGLAEAFVTHSSMQPKAQSGFKITAGTFIAQQPASWSLWAIGRKHMDKPSP